MANSSLSHITLPLEQENTDSTPEKIEITRNSRLQPSSTVVGGISTQATVGVLLQTDKSRTFNIFLKDLNFTLVRVFADRVIAFELDRSPEPPTNSIRWSSKTKHYDSTATSVLDLASRERFVTVFATQQPTGCNEWDQQVGCRNASRDADTAERQPNAIILRRYTAQLEGIDNNITLIDSEKAIYSLSGQNCGSQVKMTKSLVFVGCAERGLIEVFQRRNMERLTLVNKWQKEGIGEDWSLIEHLGGK